MWQIIDFENPDDTHSCLNCGHKGTDWAEITLDWSNDEPTEIYCPKCKSPYYFLVRRKQNG